MIVSKDMLKVIKLLKKYDVSAYELVGMLVDGLEKKLELFDYKATENELQDDQSMLEELNALSWKVTTKDNGRWGE